MVRFIEAPGSEFCGCSLVVLDLVQLVMEIKSLDDSLTRCIVMSLNVIGSLH